MKCDIIIPIWNQLGSTKECVEAIMRTTSYPYRLILVDNGSGAETKAYLEELNNRCALSAIALIRNEENLGYIKAVNQGMRISDAPYVCLMNNDTIPGIGWLEKLISFAEAHKDIGLMNPLCDGHGDLTIDEYSGRVGTNGDRYMEMNQCFGFCTLVKREVIDKTGYLDEAFGMGGYDDTDYSMRAFRAGYRCASVHSAYVYHKKHLSFKASGANNSFTPKGQEAYLKKWPRHLRIGLTFFSDRKTEDKRIEEMLKGALSLAREWCWINLWVFGKEAENRQRLESIAKKIDMPLHQNIKFNFMPKNFANLQTLSRLIERNFGTKKRKKYDAVFIDNDKAASLLKFFYPIHTTKVILVKPETWGDAQSWKKFLSQAGRVS